MKKTIDYLSILRPIIVGLGAPDEQIMPSADLVEDLGFDSLDLVEMCATLEQKLELTQISEVAADKFKTVGDVVSYLEGLKV